MDVLEGGSRKRCPHRVLDPPQGALDGARLALTLCAA